MEPAVEKEVTGGVQEKPYFNGSERESSDVELQELEKPVSDKWMGTESDRKDMRMLGRVQVLRVSIFCAIREFFSHLNSELMRSHPAAQLQLRIHARFWCCPDLYLGDYLRVGLSNHLVNLFQHS